MKFYSFLGALLISGFLSAQAPQSFTYQSVIRNNTDQLVANAPIGTKISILQGSVTGTIIYSETHNASTNSNGLLSLVVGAGTVVNGSFSSINWGNGPYFIKTETDISGGVNYTLTGTQQLMSVPYALYAETAGTAGNTTPGPQGPPGATGPTGPQGPAGVAGSVGATGAVGATGPQGPPGLTGATGATGPQGPAGVAGANGATGPQGPAGVNGATGAAGTTGQYANTVFSTGQLALTQTVTTYTLIPGLTQTVTVPANAKVYVSTNGGFQNSSAGASHATADFAIYIDGAASSVQRQVVAANTAELGQIMSQWTLSGVFNLAAGSHTIQVRARDAGGTADGNAAGANDLIKGNLTVMIIKE